MALLALMNLTMVKEKCPQGEPQDFTKKLLVRGEYIGMSEVVGSLEDDVSNRDDQASQPLVYSEASSVDTGR